MRQLLGQCLKSSRLRTYNSLPLTRSDRPDGVGEDIMLGDSFDVQHDILLASVLRPRHPLIPHTHKKRFARGELEEKKKYLTSSTLVPFNFAIIEIVGQSPTGYPPPFLTPETRSLEILPALAGQDYVL